MYIFDGAKSIGFQAKKAAIADKYALVNGNGGGAMRPMQLNERVTHLRSRHSRNSLKIVMKAEIIEYEWKKIP